MTPSSSLAHAAAPALGAVGLFTARGRMLHATPMLDALLRDPLVALSVLADELADLARHSGRRMRCADVPPFGATREIDTHIGPLTLSASLVNDRSLPTPLCLIAVSMRTPRAEERALTRFALTKRESQVAALLRFGRRNREIAGALGVSEHTARRHTERVMAKLGVTSRAAVAVALGA